MTSTMTNTSSSESDSSSSEDSSVSDLEIEDADDFEQAMITVDKAFYEEEMGLSSGPLRTKNEIVDITISKPTIEIKPDMHLTEIGSVLHVVEDQIVIKVNTTGEYKILDVGTILVLEDKEILGEIFETIGPVAHPMYVVRFNEIDKEKVIKDAKIFSVDELSKFVFTREIFEHKGCDASNAFDEEVNEEEIEFSDDEKEQAFNEMQRNKTRDPNSRRGRGGRGGRRRDIERGSSTDG
ncbi:NAF1-domain-containing protein [Rhizophagus clarus]|uniref:H/ACA ribonucleoprotein complex subunit n=1 Tax=Rhizophagus clarus TaxID=94130 RepID=A0A8H3LFG5_9GLOM|nr:NAF1-domain-containing protein [Rhizophagus clarus]